MAGALTGDDSTGLLYIGGGIGANPIRTIDAATGATVARFSPTNLNFRGMAIVNGELFASDTPPDGTYKSYINVYDPDTLVLKRRLTNSLPAGVTIDGLGGDGTGSPDWYGFSAAAGSNLVISTATPAGMSPRLDPTLELYSPGGALVSSNYHGAPDGRNALITQTATTSGVYKVRLYGHGEYLLGVQGATPYTPAFVVVGASITNGAFLNTIPTEWTVTFNQEVLLTSLEAADVTVDGIPCPSAAAVSGNGRSVCFGLPPLDDGVHVIALAAGALTSVRDLPVEALTLTFTVDRGAPRVVASSIPTNGVVPPGNLTYTATFSEPLIAAQVGTNCFTLVGDATGAYRASTLSYAAGPSTLTLSFTNLPQDRYALTLLSGDGLLEDPSGNDLDGESTNGLPSGDGVAGSNFVLQFYMDLATTNLPTPLQAQKPRGSLIYDQTLTGYVGPIGDSDLYTVTLDDPQTLTLNVRPSAGLRPTLSVSGAGGPLGYVTAPDAGQNATLQTVAIAQPGLYTITVGGAGGSMGSYMLHTLLNAAVTDTTVTRTNGTPAMAQPLDASALTLVSNATRSAVLATDHTPRLGPDPKGYKAIVVPYEFQDISASGTAILTERTVNDFVQLSSLSGFTFTFYGSTYSSVYVSLNGAITFESGWSSNYRYFPIKQELVPPTIGACMDNMLSTDGGGVYWQVVGSGTNQQLIVQWNRVRYQIFQGSDGDPGDITFQVVLGRADNTIQINYRDLSIDPDYLYGIGWYYDQGRRSGVGIKANGLNTTNYISVAFKDGPNADFVGTGHSIRFGTNLTRTGYYSLPLAAGDRVTLAGASAGTVANTQLALDLLTGAGAALTSGVAFFNGDKAIVDYLVPSNDTYIARVTPNWTNDYALVVLRNGAFDLGGNTNGTTAQPLANAAPVLGHVPTALSDYFAFELGVGGKIDATTVTPADGPGEFVNTLNPALELYGPGGTLVASNDDGAPDGRNARLSYVAATAGRHVLCVRAQAGAGEYRLDPDIRYLINASADAHGSISPTGDVWVAWRESQSFAIAPHTWFNIADVQVDGGSQGALAAYTFGSVTGNHAIVARFEPQLAPLGTPLWWLAQYGWTNNAAAAELSDTDTDGLKAWQEQRANTHPTNGLSVFRILHVAIESNDVRLVWMAGGDRTNVIQATGDLGGSLTNISPPIVIPAGGDVQTNYLDIGGATNRLHQFYRIGIGP